MWEWSALGKRRPGVAVWQPAVPEGRAADVGELVAGEEALQTEPGAMGAQGALGAAPAKRETQKRSYSSSIFNQSATCGEIV